MDLLFEDGKESEATYMGKQKAALFIAEHKPEPQADVDQQYHGYLSGKSAPQVARTAISILMEESEGRAESFIEMCRRQR